MTEIRMVQDYEEGTIVQWHASKGDKVMPGDDLCDVEIEKVVISITAQQEGIISEILIKEGESARRGEVIALMDA